MAGPIEQKAVAAPATTLVAGYLSTVLITSVPWIHTHLTADQQQNLPIIIAFLLSAAAAYIAPHTHRPDLVPSPPSRSTPGNWPPVGTNPAANTASPAVPAPTPEQVQPKAGA